MTSILMVNEWYVISSLIFFTRHCGKSTGVTNNINNGSVVFNCLSRHDSVSEHEQHQDAETEAGIIHSRLMKNGHLTISSASQKIWQH